MCEIWRTRERPSSGQATAKATWRPERASAVSLDRSVLSVARPWPDGRPASLARLPPTPRPCDLPKRAASCPQNPDRLSSSSRHLHSRTTGTATYERDIWTPSPIASDNTICLLRRARPNRALKAPRGASVINPRSGSDRGCSASPRTPPGAASLAAAGRLIRHTLGNIPGASVSLDVL